MVVYEIGVGPVELCRSKEHWGKAECVLFEPASFYYKEIVQQASEHPNVQVHNIAIYDYDGYCEFIENSQMSFIKGLNSPQVQFGIHDGLHRICPCAKISKFDKGNIDLLLLDMEGAEWFVLKYLISRPDKIIVETELASRYKNPFLEEIQTWMQINGYHNTDTIGADTVWEKSHKVFL
jgi:FkbM family methyltransferase